MISSLLPSETGVVGVVGRDHVLRSGQILFGCLMLSNNRARAVTTATPKVTDRIYFDVRISRSDGTFYERDEDENDDKVFYGRLLLELFGEVAPTTVQRFKSYIPNNDVVVNVNNNDDDPFDPWPTLAQSGFSSLDPATGVLWGGKIPGLEVVEVGGSPALRFGDRILSPATLWIEPPKSPSAKPLLRHVGIGLLTHRILEPLPLFGITTRSDTTQLDGSHVVFGRVVWEDDLSRAFLKAVSDLPTYRVDSRPSSSQSSVVEDAAQEIFQAQRSFFRETAKALGDTRLDKVYEGKLLRRVEVTRVGFLK